MDMFGLVSVVLAGCTEYVSGGYWLQMIKALCVKVDSTAYLLVVLSCT